jgi:hypothetical protein
MMPIEHRHFAAVDQASQANVLYLPFQAALIDATSLDKGVVVGSAGKMARFAYAIISRDRSYRPIPLITEN